MRIEEEIKQKKFDSEYQKVYINLHFTINWLRDHSKDVYKEFDITSQQFNVLRILRGAYPNVKSAGEIKEVMLDKSPDLTRLMDRLILKKLAEREICPDNRRKMDIKITKKGLDLLEKMDSKIKDSEKVLHSLSKEEANQLSNLLDKIRS